MRHTSRGSAREGTAGALTPNGDPVLTARFAVPSVPETFIRKTRLADRLTRALAGPGRLVLVNGPAGAGKTLLVADWAGTPPLPGRVVWLTAESGDNAPGIFWAYVLEALRHHGLTLPDGIAGPARPGEVDDSLLSQLGLRLVIISRTEPLLPLHRYRTAGEVAEIRDADLAFLPEETAELASRHGMALSDEGARALTERTGGWAAGLRLCILAAQGADDPESFLKEFETGQSAVADFLLAEVLQAQSAVSQDLLLRTSICERIHPGLANSLTGRDDAALVLSELRRANALVEPLGHSWYRLHPLFRRDSACPPEHQVPRAGARTARHGLPMAERCRAAHGGPAARRRRGGLGVRGGPAR
ncbi:hypothetical protein F0344_16640 [Streptomyces finlayi]|uniref:MalT-like winged helix domain-containing protein n=1 Tax=Streptomyces finlayi TaxID=67296 RepID=A0A7G7BL16_9ACTN|nr:hypothetical protein [Streptomyces finlayi]QNE76031.1 hypothetical protein F0344_16640 [Streptomyces finlayi]